MIFYNGYYYYYYYSYLFIYWVSLATVKVLVSGTEVLRIALLDKWVVPICVLRAVDVLGLWPRIKKPEPVLEGHLGVACRRKGCKTNIAVPVAEAKETESASEEAW